MCKSVDDKSENGIVFRRDVSDRRGTLTGCWRFPLADHVSILIEISFVQQFQTFVLQNRLGVKFAVDLLLTLFTFARRFVVEKRFVRHEQGVPLAPDLRRNQTETNESFSPRRDRRPKALLFCQLSIFADLQGEIDQLSRDAGAKFDVFPMFRFRFVRLNDIVKNFIFFHLFGIFDASETSQFLNTFVMIDRPERFHATEFTASRSIASTKSWFRRISNCRS